MRRSHISKSDELSGTLEQTEVTQMLARKCDECLLGIIYCSDCKAYKAKAVVSNGIREQNISLNRKDKKEAPSLEALINRTF